jgi:protein-L-isoaspartate(D-aspartate) O-methyltransferase
MPDRSEALRKTYARKIARLGGVGDPRVEAAFAAVPREDFSGPAPWYVSGGLFGRSAGSDVASLYDDVLVAIDARRGINNGQPSLHARSIEALNIREGETVVQIGAGAGYYTAILAELVGPNGKVVAYEIERDIARRASDNLMRYPQAEVRAQSGVGQNLPKADAIYVNAAATHPPRAWLDALKDGGRLLFPMHAAGSTGAMLLVTRPPEGDVWPARFLCAVIFIACAGAQDAGIARRLDQAFRRGGSGDVRSLRFGDDPRPSDWLRGDGWKLSTETP